MRYGTIAALATWLLTSALFESAAAQTADTTFAPGRRARVEPAPRTAWMFGVGAGYGYGAPRTPAAAPDQEGGGTFQLRVGAGVGGGALLGLEYLTATASPTDSTSWEIVGGGVGVTWFWPSNLYLRGTVGWAQVGSSLLADGAPPGTPPSRLVDDGFAFAGAVGWEWRYRRRLGLAPQIEYLHAGLARSTSVRLASASLHLNWYF